MHFLFVIAAVAAAARKSRENILINDIYLHSSLIIPLNPSQLHLPLDSKGRISKAFYDGLCAEQEDITDATTFLCVEGAKTRIKMYNSGLYKNYLSNLRTFVDFKKHLIMLMGDPGRIDKKTFPLLARDILLFAIISSITNSINEGDLFYICTGITFVFHHKMVNHLNNRKDSSCLKFKDYGDQEMKCFSDFRTKNITMKNVHLYSVLLDRLVFLLEKYYPGKYNLIPLCRIISKQNPHSNISHLYPPLTACDELYRKNVSKISPSDYISASINSYGNIYLLQYLIKDRNLEKISKALMVTDQISYTWSLYYDPVPIQVFDSLFCNFISRDYKKIELSSEVKLYFDIYFSTWMLMQSIGIADVLGLYQHPHELVLLARRFSFAELFFLKEKPNDKLVMLNFLFEKLIQSSSNLFLNLQ